MNDPFCILYDEDFSLGEFDPGAIRKKEKWQGHEEDITRFSDGSSIRHGGGPAGDMYYNKFGEEC